MKITGVPFGVTDWSKVPQTRQEGLSGFATSREIDAGGISVRMVEYSPGYVADHWCSKGHILLVLEGVLFTEIQGGATHTLTAGMNYQVADDMPPHRSSTKTGVRIFIVD